MPEKLEQLIRAMAKVPTETADLAEELRDLFPDLAKDESITAAALILHGFKARGWTIVGGVAS